MIIDEILDRKDDEECGATYDPRDFYRYLLCCVVARDYADDISAAMDYGTNADVRAALCRYIDGNGYNPEIKSYINCRNWI